MRHVLVTTRYVLAVPQDQESGLDAVMNTGVSVMEGKIREFARGIQSIESDWQLMPMDYTRGMGADATPDPHVKNDATPSGFPPIPVVHPWDQGLWIFPEDHPLRPFEERAKAGDEDAQVVLDRAVDAVKELTSGSNE